MNAEPSPAAQGQSAHSCHWSVPTLFMPGPYWLFAWNTPWCCWNDHEILALRSTDGCVDCRLWKARASSPSQTTSVQPEGAIPLEASARVRFGDGYGRKIPAR